MEVLHLFQSLLKNVINLNLVDTKKNTEFEKQQKRVILSKITKNCKGTFK